MERLQYAGDLGLTIVADLVHYGTPTWLDDSFADIGYPDAIAEFAGAFAARYRGLVVLAFGGPRSTIIQRSAGTDGCCSVPPATSTTQ